eukprot:2684992-Pyramimonas_sp.AAC.1
MSVNGVEAATNDPQLGRRGRRNGAGGRKRRGGLARRDKRSRSRLTEDRPRRNAPPTASEPMR